jgi:predicted glutamine amidotransferase
MCGIAGYSLSENSRIQPRKLAKALLTEIQSRGNQASGYAWQSSTGSGIYKRDVAGSALSMKPMSRGTRVAVLHTRYATHGSITDNANNHPVLSPDKSVALVHNGVIYNHNTVRGEIPFRLPEVDSSVIPALLQTFERDTQSFEKLDGDASVAWLDDNDRFTLNVARISYSPLCIAQLADGSFVFASTEQLLLSALDRINQRPVFLENVAEYTLLKVENGRITTQQELPATAQKYVEKASYDYTGFRYMTAGGKSTSTPKPYANANSLFIPNDWYDEDLVGYTYDPDIEESEDYSFGIQEPEFYGYPVVSDYVCNEFGEYFDRSGMFMGTIDDFVHMGYLTESDLADFSKSWYANNFEDIS